MREIFERLVAANIQILPLGQIANHVVFERGGYISLVERLAEGLGRVGAGGLLTARGFAALMWRDGVGMFVAKGGFERVATEADIAELRRFQSDLEQAIQR